MWKLVESAVDELRPVLEAYGLQVEVVDVIDGVVTLKVVQAEGSTLPFPDNLPDLVTRTLQNEVEGVREVIIERPAKDGASGVSISVDPTSEEETTCVITLDKVVVPGGSLVFNSAHDAEAWPLIRALFDVPHVTMVMARDNRLLVSRDGGAWDEVIAGLTRTITEFYGGGTTSHAIDEDLDEDDIRRRVEAVLDAEVNPAVAAHGGFINLLDVKGSTIYVHMGGGCQGCGMASVTLRQGVDKLIREAVPQVKRILDTTDHAAGENPYYQPMG